jgi:hypothetical protein
MWYREAQQGIMNLDTKLIQNAEQLITNWISEWTTQVPEGLVFEKNIEIPPYLKKFISNISHNVPEGALGTFDPKTKTLYLPEILPKNQLSNLISTVLHEVRHSVDPRYNNDKLMDKYRHQYYRPNAIKTEIYNYFAKNSKIPDYGEIISNYIINSGGNPNNPEVRKIWEEGFTKSAYDVAYKSILQQRDLYLNNPIEHSSQLGDIARLLSKKNLDAVRDHIKRIQGTNLNDIQLRAHLKNGLNPNSRDFEAYSQILQQVSGNQASSLSDIVKSIKDPKWQEQYLKQVSNAVSVYNKDNRFKGLVRKENRMQPGVKSNPKFNLEDNANAMKSRAAFFSKAAQLESLAESNPRAWNKFINSTFATRMISTKLYNVFKNIGTGSKSLSQSLKGLNMNSPLWALLEPALEFGLYQFGLYLENPSAYNLETPEQKTIKDLNARINEIIADPKIRDKRGYFIQNYGSYLKTLGSMEQNALLGKFPVMGFGNFMNIGRNIGQK